MNPFVTLIILGAAFGVSWYTAHAAGRFWTETKIVGGWTRFMVVSSLILSALGFTGVYFMALLIGLSLMDTPLSQLDVSVLFPLSLGVLGAPGVGAAPNLWLNGQVMSRRQQMLGAAATPGANLPVDAVDVLDLGLRSPGFFRQFGSFFGIGGGGGSDGGGGGDSDSGKLVLILLVIALAVLAVCAGVVTTILIVQHADQEHVSEIYELYKPPEMAKS